MPSDKTSSLEFRPQDLECRVQGLEPQLQGLNHHDPDDPFLEAGQALSQALSALGINHAFIGGFAVNLLGSQRSTDDIDVEFDTTDGIKFIGRLVDPALGGDSRFTFYNNKLVFIPLDHDISQRTPHRTATHRRPRPAKDAECYLPRR